MVSRAEQIEYARAAVEQYRARARSVATLVAAVAGAIFSGVVVAAVPRVPAWIATLALGSAIAMAIATALFTSASLQKRTAPYNSETLSNEVSEVIDRIDRRIRLGSWFAGAATVGMFAAGGFALLPPPDEPYRVRLTDTTWSDSLIVCPSLPQTFDALNVQALDNANPTVHVIVNGRYCDSTDDEINLVVPRSGLAALASRS